MSPARVLTFRTHKARETENACEDSVYPGPGESSQELFAVADGATQSFYSRIWAQKLTSRFAEKGQDAFEKWDTWLKAAQDEWRNEVAAEIEKRPEDVYTTNGFNERRPAAATFVGLQLLPAQTRDMVAWRALILGDSCLFHLSSKGNVYRYPKQNAADFTFITESIESYPRPSEQKPTRLATIPVDQARFVRTVEAQRGDAFLLATDAFSKWMIECEEAKEPVWGEVAYLENDEKFKKLVAVARADLRRPLQDDDVALVVVRFGELHPVFSTQKYVPKLATSKTLEPPPRQKSPLPENAFQTPTRTSVLDLPPRSEKELKKSAIVPSHAWPLLVIGFLLGLALLVNFGLAGIEWVGWRTEIENQDKVREDLRTIIERVENQDQVTNDLKTIKEGVSSLESKVAGLASASVKYQVPADKLAASTSAQKPGGTDPPKATEAKNEAAPGNGNVKNAPNKGISPSPGIPPPPAASPP